MRERMMNLETVEKLARFLIEKKYILDFMGESDAHVTFTLKKDKMIYLFHLKINTTMKMKHWEEIIKNCKELEINFATEAGMMIFY
jgi:hypothetical protein